MIVGELFVNGGMITIGDAITVENLEIRPNTTMGNSTQGLTIISPNLVSIEDVTIIPGSGGNNVGLFVNGGFLSCDRCEIKDGQSLAVRVIDEGRLRLLNSRISNNINSTGTQGAGMRLDEGDVTVTDSLIDNNQALGFGV